MSFFNPKFMLTDLGFDGVTDWLTSIIGFKGNLLAPLSFLFAGSISLFVENYIWENPAEIYFLAILIGIDLLTGIWKSIKFRKDPTKRFRSRRISRTVGKTITYTVMLYMAFNLDQKMPHVFFWMPYSFLGVFYATESWSVIENFSELGYLDYAFVKYLKKKLNINNILSKEDSDDEDKESRDNGDKNISGYED